MFTFRGRKAEGARLRRPQRARVDASGMRTKTAAAVAVRRDRRKLARASRR
jgi:hypothetical protein